MEGITENAGIIDLKGIRAARKSLGMTQSELAAKAGITQQHLSKIERLASDASASTLRRIASALGVGIAIR